MDELSEYRSCLECGAQVVRRKIGFRCPRCRQWYCSRTQLAPSPEQIAVAARLLREAHHEQMRRGERVA